MERLLCPVGLSGICTQDMEVKMLAGLRAYFGTLPMLGMSIDPADTVPEHVGVIHAFTHHQEKRAGCQAPGRGGEAEWMGLSDRGASPRSHSSGTLGQQPCQHWFGDGNVKLCKCPGGSFSLPSRVMPEDAQLPISMCLSPLSPL